MCSVQRVCQIRVFYLAWKVSDDFPQEVIDNAMKKKNQQRGEDSSWDKEKRIFLIETWKHM